MVLGEAVARRRCGRGRWRSSRRQDGKVSRGERRLGLELSGGRPASGWSRERLVELVVLERWQSWLVVRLTATAFGPLLLRRRVGTWRWRIFLHGCRRWCSKALPPHRLKTATALDGRWRCRERAHLLPSRSLSSCCHRRRRRCLAARHLQCFFFEAEPRSLSTAEPQPAIRTCEVGGGLSGRSGSDSDNGRGGSGGQRSE